MMGVYLSDANELSDHSQVLGSLKLIRTIKTLSKFRLAQDTFRPGHQNGWCSGSKIPRIGHRTRRQQVNFQVLANGSCMAFKIQNKTRITKSLGADGFQKKLQRSKLFGVGECRTPVKGVLHYVLHGLQRCCCRCVLLRGLRSSLILPDGEKIMDSA